MGADKGLHLRGCIPFELAEPHRRFGSDRSIGAFPPGMHHCKSILNAEHHGNAVGKAQKHRDICDGAKNAIGAGTCLDPSGTESLWRIRSDFYQTVPMDLRGHHKVLFGSLSAHRAEHAMAVLRHAPRIVAHRIAQVERGKGRGRDSPISLCKRERDPVRAVKTAVQGHAMTSLGLKGGLRLSHESASRNRGYRTLCLQSPRRQAWGPAPGCGVWKKRQRSPWRAEAGRSRR